MPTGGVAGDAASGVPAGSNRARLVEAVGWYGAFGLISAYLLVSFSLVEAESLLYQLLNLSGAIGIIVISAYKRVFQSVAINVIWSIVAVAALLRLAL